MSGTTSTECIEKSNVSSHKDIATNQSSDLQDYTTNREGLGSHILRRDDPAHICFIDSRAKYGQFFELLLFTHSLKDLSLQLKISLEVIKTNTLNEKTVVHSFHLH